MRVVYSKGCKHKPQCQVNVTAWYGDKPYWYDDPHQCGTCGRRYPRILGRYISGLYTCGKKDCFSVHLEKMVASMSPAMKQYFASAEKTMKKLRKKKRKT